MFLFLLMLLLWVFFPFVVVKESVARKWKTIFSLVNALRTLNLWFYERKLRSC
ncbi:hypothetical protein Hanom_Chr17g01527191 [Helianthus anomalus]